MIVHKIHPFICVFVAACVFPYIEFFPPLVTVLISSFKHQCLLKLKSLTFFHKYVLHYKYEPMGMGLTHPHLDCHFGSDVEVHLRQSTQGNGAVWKVDL